MKAIEEVYSKDNETGIVREYLNKTKIADLAEKYNTSKDMINKITKKYGVNGMNNRGKTKTKFANIEQRIVYMYTEERNTVKEISEKTGVSKNNVRTILKAKNVKINTGGRGKLNTEALEKMYAAGIPIKKIAEVFEVTVAAVYNYIRDNNLEEKDEKEEIKKKRVCIKEGDTIILKAKRDNENKEKNVVVEIVKDNYIVCKHQEGYKETFTKEDLMIGFSNKKIRLLTL